MPTFWWKLGDELEADGTTGAEVEEVVGGRHNVKFYYTCRGPATKKALCQYQAAQRGKVVVSAQTSWNKKHFCYYRLSTKMHDGRNQVKAEDLLQKKHFANIKRHNEVTATKW